MKALVMIVVIFCATFAHAEQAASESGDDLARYLYPPELVFKYRRDIGLDDVQTKTLKELVQQAQSRFLDLQWDLQGEAGKVAQLLRIPRVDESAALAQVDRVLIQEREVKKAQLTLLIRIKNLLTAEQQQKLSALRQTAP